MEELLHELRTHHFPYCTCFRLGCIWGWRWWGCISFGYSERKNSRSLHGGSGGGSSAASTGASGGVGGGGGTTESFLSVESVPVPDPVPVTPPYFPYFISLSSSCNSLF